MIDNKTRIEFLYSMKRVRNFEMESIEMYKNGEMPGFLHPCVGQEASASGSIAALKKTDMILSNHRGHGHLVAKGVNLNYMMAELFAKETGCCKGRGGSMHIMSPDQGILGSNGIVGAGISIAPGVALASKMKGSDQVVMCFFGDGASNIGSFHEGINLASIWNLPVVFVCENNQYAESTLTTYATNIAHLSERGAAYGIPGVTVDGNDVEAVYEQACIAVERARRGEGPTLLECFTYKWYGHYVGDPALYRSDEEVEAWKAKDPIVLYSRKLISAKVLTEEDIAVIDKKIKEELEEAISFAKSSPDPDPAQAMYYNYVEGGDIA